jgi:hypothetical protein
VVSLAEGQLQMAVTGGISRTERAFVNHVVGEPFSQVMVYDFKRDDTGNLVLDASGLPLASDKIMAVGTGVHPITGGWNNEVTYGNISLAFLIDYKFGAVIYSGTNARAYQYGLHKETLNGREEGVTLTGVDEDGEAVTANVRAQDYYARLVNISKLHVYDADFIKLRSVSITYTFPRKLFNGKVNDLSLSLVGRNLFYIKKDTDNIDPEANYNNTNAQGLEYTALPTTRTYGINISAKF